MVPEVQLGAFLEEAPGAEPALAATAYSLMGVGGLLARLALAAVVLRYEVDNLLILQGCSVALGVAIVGLGAHGRAPAYVAAYAVAHGFLTNLGFNCVPPALLELVGAEAFPDAVGWSFSLRAPLVLLAPPLAGLGRELAGGFEPVWTLTGALSAASAAPICVAHFRCKRLAGGRERA
jgi:hypothetical protein